MSFLLTVAMGVKPCHLLLAWFLLLLMPAPSVGLTMLTRLRDDTDLSEFYSLVDRNEAAKQWLEESEGTIFVPTNQAFQQYSTKKTHIHYHMVSTAYTLEQMRDTLTSNYDGNTLLYVTRVGSNGSDPDTIYINNAKVVPSRANLEFRNRWGNKQYMHVIESVLVPITVVAGFNKTYGANPNAWEFLQNSEAMNIEPLRVRSMRMKVASLDQQQVFRMSGQHTFFIPEESAFKQAPFQTRSMMDQKVIGGHILPNKTIFTAAAQYGVPYKTMSFDDSLRITVTFFELAEGKETRTYVISNTMYGNSRHTAGAVVAEIMKANIPVRNGVVHVIQRPLVIVDKQGVQMITHINYNLWSKFRELIEDYAPDFIQVLRMMSQATLFVPHNDAVIEMMQTNFQSDRKKLREALLLHVVPDALTVEIMHRNNRNLIYQVPTLSIQKFIYCNVNENRTSHLRSVTVEAGGVNASVVVSDLATTDGYIHIIDRVLGVPYMTVQKKLETDPMLNLTYQFGRLNRFNEQLKQTNKRFTYFVPRDKGWTKWFAENPDASLGQFALNREQTLAVLQRHMVVADRVFTIRELHNMSHDTLTLPTFSRDSFQIKVKEEDRRFYILWKGQGEWTTVFRSDVDCTNGIIHVIDYPFMTRDDVVSNANTSAVAMSVTQPFNLGVLLMTTVALSAYISAVLN